MVLKLMSPMAQELRSRVFNSLFTIVFFLLILFGSKNALSQSVLLPGDVVIVSVNSSEDSFDFIPLVKLERGTKVWFSNGKWDENTLTITEGAEVEIVIKDPIEAGTNIHINEIEDPRVEVTGHLFFSGEGDRVLAFQKDEGISRVIYGIGWGNLEIWNHDLEVGSEIPTSISKETKTLLHLGLEDNYQYYLRNGASGTPSMLLSFVGDVANWRGKSKAFNSIGTAFRILAPPVILFNESVSTVKEGDLISLNVAIYEHDGSKLSVDVEFNPFTSTADTNDVSGFQKKTFNFTGLIGDAVYGVEIPTHDDDQFEGTENAFFQLTNLTKGHFGDFVTHLAFIPDNEIPAVELIEISYANIPNADFIKIQNTENEVVDLSGWKLTSRGFSFEFEENFKLEPFQTFKLFNSFDEEGDERAWLNRDNGTLDLRAPDNKKVSSLRYNLQIASSEKVKESETRNTKLSSEDIGSPKIVQSVSSKTQILGKESPQKEGWYTTSPEQNELKERFFWNERLQTFERVDALEFSSEFGSTQIAFFSTEELELSLEKSVQASEDSLANELLIEPKREVSFTISATDVDENGIVNGFEGYNFIQNNSDFPIRVKDFLFETNKQLKENALYPMIFLWENDGMGWETSSVLAEQEMIPSKASFWVKADSSFEKTQIFFQAQDFSEEEEYSEFEEPITSISFELTNENSITSLTVNLFEEANTIRVNELNPKMEFGSFSTTNDFLLAGLNYGANWNSVVNLKNLESERIVLPIGFNTSTNGEIKFSVKDWSNVPSDWQIFIEDTETGREYEINQRWQLEFEFRAKESENELEYENQNEPFILQKKTIEDRFKLVLTPSGIEESFIDSPDEISLNQNYPNPFNPTTTISFFLPESIEVKLTIFNVVGQPVAVLADGVFAEGEHEFEWNATGLPSGMYIYQLEVGTKVMTQKMTLVK